jgi:hypothetical protein
LVLALSRESDNPFPAPFLGFEVQRCCTSARRRDRGCKRKSPFAGNRKARPSSLRETASVFGGGRGLECARAAPLAFVKRALRERGRYRMAETGNRLGTRKRVAPGPPLRVRPKNGSDQSINSRFTGHWISKNMRHIVSFCPMFIGKRYWIEHKYTVPLQRQRRPTALQPNLLHNEF